MTVRKHLLAAAFALGLAGSGAAQATLPVFNTTDSASQSSFVANAYGFSVNNPGWYEVTLTDNANSSAFEALTLNILHGFSTTGVSLGGISGPGTFSFLANTVG